MKKTLAMLYLLLLVSLVPFYSLAEEIDLSSLSDSELLTLDARVKEEIEKRDLSTNAVLVPSGKYYVGKDLRPGTYVLTLSELVSYASRGIYYVYGSQEDLDNNKALNSSTVELGKEGQVTVEDGQILSLHYGTWMLQEGKLPFAP